MLSVFIGDKVKMSEAHKNMAVNIAAGSLIALLSLELIPMMHDTNTTNEKLMTIAGIIIGVILLKSLKSSDKSKNKSNNTVSQYKVYLPLFIGLFLDGFIIGIQKGNGSASTGLLLALALSIDNLLVGLGIGADIGDNTRKLMMVAVVLGMSVILGTFTGMHSIKMLEGSPLLKGIVAFGVTALMWETYQELMPETKKLETPYNLFGMYMGFILVFVVNWFA